MSSWYWIFGLLAATFVSRWWPRIVRPHALGDDTYYHLAHAERIRVNGFRLHESHPQFVLPAQYAYPPLYHYILALFDRCMRARIERISSAVADTLLVGIFIWCSIIALLPLGWSWPQLLFLGVIFALSPALTAGMGTGPRAYQGTPRTLGELLAAAAFVAFWQFWLHQHWAWMVGGLVFATLLLLCSKFGAQVLLFFSLLMAFLLNSVTFLITPLICFILAIVFSQGRYWSIASGQFKHLRLYATKIVHTHPMLMWRKRWQWPRTLREAYEFFLYRSPVGVFVFKFYTVLLVLILLVGKSSGGPMRDSFLLAWLIAAVILFLIVSTPYFLFIGAAERYLEYALIPAVLLLGITVTDSSYQDSILLGLALVTTLLYVLNAYVFVIRFRGDKHESLQRAIEHLNAEETGVVLSICGSAPWELAYWTDHKIFFGTLAQMSETDYTRFFWKYPLPNANLSMYAKEFGVTLVLAAKQVVQRAQTDGCHYSFEGFRSIWENKDFVIFKVDTA